MPPRTTAAAAPPEATSPPPADPLLAKLAGVVNGHALELDALTELNAGQTSLNWKIIFCLLCLLGVLVIQDKEIQALAKAVKSLQS
jgi:hypothetical protein